MSDIMTIKDAIRELLKTDKFQEDARKDAKLRVFRQRFLAGEIKNGAAISLLQDYGYKVDIRKQHQK